MNHLECKNKPKATSILIWKVLQLSMYIIMKLQNTINFNSDSNKNDIYFLKKSLLTKVLQKELFGHNLTYQK